MQDSHGYTGSVNKLRLIRCARTVDQSETDNKDLHSLFLGGVVPCILGGSGPLHSLGECSLAFLRGSGPLHSLGDWIFISVGQGRSGEVRGGQMS